MIHCAKCGKFISRHNAVNSLNVKFVFIPDTLFSVEEQYWEHIICPKKKQK